MTEFSVLSVPVFSFSVFILSLLLSLICLSFLTVPVASSLRLSGSLCLRMSTNSPQVQPTLASASWDHTVRIWDLFHARAATETLEHNTDVVALAYRPDGKELCMRQTMHNEGHLDRQLIASLFSSLLW